MKKLILIITVIHTAFCISYSQSGWFPQNSNTPYDLYSVHFPLNQTTTGWAAGDNGVMRKTTNGGNGWYGLNSGVTTDLKAVFFTSLEEGYSVGVSGTIRKTTNGGINWFAQTSGTTWGLYSVYFPVSNTGWVVGEAYVVLKTTNGGANWFSQSVGTAMLNLSVQFINEQTGWLTGGSNRVHKTTNSGVNWIMYYMTPGNTLYSLNFPTAETGWVAGANSSIYKTTNGGINWFSQPAGTNLVYLSVYFVSSESGWTVGQSGSVRATTNSGNNWVPQSCGTTEILHSVFFPTQTIGWIVGDNGTIRKTTTGGWSLPGVPTLLSPPNSSINVTLTPLFDWADLTGAISYHLQVSTDSLFTSFTIIDSNLIASQYVVGGGILTYCKRYFWRVRAKNILGWGQWSAVWSFRTIASPLPVLLSPPNNSTGQSLTPLLDWDSLAVALTYRVQLGLDSSFSPVIIDDSNVTKSSYQVQSGLLTNNTLYFWRVNAKNECGSGPWSAIWNFRTLIIGINLKNNEIPKEYKLYNNYPNPFNPVTKIRFDIPKKSDTKIMVYDILGREIEVILDINLDPGRYEVEWNGAGYSSGVYFYRLTAGDYVETKKMILMK